MAKDTDQSSPTTPSAASSAPPKKPAFQLSPEPVSGVESEAEVQKFVVSQETVDEWKPEISEPSPQPTYEDLGALPVTYDEDTLFLVARDPRWLFAYWDFNWGRFPASRMRYGYAQFFLKIFRGAYDQECLVEINPVARNWYVAVNHPDADYSAEIGYFDQEGAWRKIATSGVAHTPADALAAETQTVDFATVPAHLTFERLLELIQERMADGETLMAALARIAGEGRVQFRAGAAPTWNDEQKRLLSALLGDSLIDQVGLGSEEIDQLLRKQLNEKLYSEAASGLSGAGMSGLLAEMAPSTQSLFSAIGASWSAQPFSVRAERGFYMHVNAEIIFYGGTHPDAAVTVNGKPIKLTPDGSFRYHFTLPDGDFNIPIVATSPDKVEQRSATLSFYRGTERQGDVGATGQPTYLDPLIGKKG